MDHEPLKPMGTQTADSVQVEAAERAKKARDQLDEDAATGEQGTKQAGQAAGGALEEVRVDAKVAIDMAAAYARERPTEALLIACAAGAVLMGLVMLASKRD